MTQFNMPVELLSSAEEFLRRTQSLRALDPFRTNILGSVATAVATGNQAYESYFWWVLTDETGNVTGAAMRTAPHGMVLSPMSLDTIGELATAVSIHDDLLPSVSGPTNLVEAFLEKYTMTQSPGSQRPSEVKERHLLYGLAELSIPAAEGAMTVATADDHNLILEWYIEFGEETGVFMPNPEASVQSGLDRDSVRFWIVDGEKVSLAGHASIVEMPNGSIGRIGPVYTPTQYRRHGYAGALTARLSQELLNKGSKVMLYTDADNPTSNGIYQKIGFELIDENVKVDFMVGDV